MLIGDKLRQLLFQDGNVSIIVGNLGSGKTLFATMYAVLNQDKYDLILANYKINLKNSDVIKNVASVFTYDPEKSKLLILDEAYLIMDSRRSSSKRNLLVWDTLRLARKHNVHIILITQIYSAIDIRLRKIASTIIVMDNNNRMYIEQLKKMKLTVVKKFQGKEYNIILSNIDKYFKYYNSYEDVEDIKILESDEQ